MSADIYTKAFKDLAAWSHALKLINMFKFDELAAAALHEWVDKRNELANTPSDKTEDRAGWSKEGQRMNP